MKDDIKRLFDANASHYDPERRQLIPCFDDFYGMALSLVDSASPSPRILDLGTGTGLFAAMILEKYPAAQLTLVDLSDSMIAVAKERFGPSDRIDYLIADYTEMELDGGYDFVVSSLSIHHLPHPLKQRLFGKVHSWLRDGGAFVNADQAAGHTAAADAYYRKRWLESVHASGLAASSIEASLRRRALDINATVADQLSWMEQAGFTDVDCLYKSFDFTVFYGQKASSPAINA